MVKTRYAIGDVHGCLTSLDALLRQIERRRRDHPGEIVFLGDYVDRGPDSKGVIERVIGSGAVTLLGNHEDLMLGALDGGERESALWLANGGEATLRSYGCPDVATFRQAIPGEHLRFLRGLRLSYETSSVFFAHAGIDPVRRLADQRRHDLLWMREPFLDHPGPFEKRVVHDHTPNLSGPEIRPWRVNADTGCVRGGPLTCVVMEDDTVRHVLQVPGSS